MPNKNNKHDLIISYLDDSGLCEIKGDVANPQRKAIYQALSDIPTEVLKKCIKAKVGLVLADRTHYEREKGMTSNGVYSSNGKNRSITINANRTPAQIKRTMRHEMGHAIDDVNKRGRQFASLKSQRFLKATDQYLANKKNAPATEMVFEHDRSFRRDHKPLYEISINPVFIKNWQLSFLENFVA